MPKLLKSTAVASIAAIAVCIALGIATVGHAAATGVCEIQNLGKQPVSFTVTRSGINPRMYVLAAGERTQISVADAAVMKVPSGQRMALAAEMRYEFRDDGKGGIALDRVERRATATGNSGQRSGRDPTASKNATDAALAAINPTSPSTIAPLVPTLDATDPAPSSSATSGSATASAADSRRTMAKVAVVTVKLFVDDEEAARTELWHKRLADRLAAASKIIEATSSIRFQVTDYGTWDSDDKNGDFARSLSEFEKEADPAPARVAVGFSSQFKIDPGAVHLGGTRGPLCPHILLREWSKQTSENERLEVLVHELGHYLGAVHSRENDSVMRSKLGDRISRVKGFEIRYDDANARIMRQLGEEMRSRPVRSLRDLSSRTKADLLDRYNELLKIQPDDPATRRHIELIRQAGAGQ